MKTKQIRNMLDQVFTFYSQGNFDDAHSKSVEILQASDAAGAEIIDCSAEQSKLIGITLVYLALIADKNTNELEAIQYYDKSIAYYQQSLSKEKNIRNKKDLEYDISGLFYNKSVVYQNLKFKEKDGDYDVDKVKEYTAQERHFLYQAASDHLNIEEILSDPMRHRLATIYYNLAKNYESDNDLTTDLGSSLSEAQRYYKLSLGFVNKVSNQYRSEADVFTIEETRDDIKKALKGIGNLLNVPSEEIESEISEEKTSGAASSSAKTKSIPKKASTKAEFRGIASVNNNIANGLTKLSRYVSTLDTEEDESRLWQHQKTCLANISEALNTGVKHGFVNMATGTGKTTEFATLIKEMGMETIVVAPTNILVQQIAEEIRKKAPSLDIGTIDGTYKRKGSNVTVITYASFEKMHELDAFSNVKLIILDEVHSSLSQKRIRAIEHFKTQSLKETSSSAVDNRPIIIGFTATDYFNSARKEGDYTRVDELLLHKFFEYPIEQGIDDKVLHPCKIAEIQLDDAINRDLKRILRKKRIKNADADITAADLEFLKQEEINRVITDVICNVSDPENGESLYGKSGLIFAIDIGHAESIASEINHTLGENYAACIHSQMSKKEQAAILEKHKSGEIKTLVNVDMLTVGYDDKQLKYIIDFRPTKSSTRLIQTFGRLTRQDDANPEAKTYIQLVLPDMNMKVSDLFHRRTRLGEINTRAFDHSEKLGKDTNVGSHCYYQVVFSNGDVCERAVEKKNLGIASSMSRGATSASIRGHLSKEQSASREIQDFNWMDPAAIDLDWGAFADIDWDAEKMDRFLAKERDALDGQSLSVNSEEESDSPTNIAKKIRVEKESSGDGPRSAVESLKHQRSSSSSQGHSRS